MVGMSVHPRPDREVRVGIVGPHELVERIMLSSLPQAGHSGPQTIPADSELGLRRRLVMAPYLSEHEAPEKVTRLGAGADACLFASRIPLDYARRAGVLACPATCIQLGGTPLYAAVLEAGRNGIDAGHGSFDGPSRAEVEACLTDLGIPTQGVHVRDEVATAAAISSFHERLWRLGQTSAAFTCMEQVVRRLSAAGVPTVRLKPTDRAIRSALQVATLLASHRSLSDSQLAIAVVEVPALRDTARRPGPRQAREELQLTVHRFLVREAQRIQATVSRISEHGFVILATRAFLPATGDPPFVARARSALGLVLDVGVGSGRSEHEAEAQARLALGQAIQLRAAQAQSPRAPGVQPRRAVSQGAVSHGAGSQGAHAQGAGAKAGQPGHSAGSSARPPGPEDVASSLADAGATSGPVSALAVTSLGMPQQDGRATADAVRQPTDSLSRLRALETLSRLAQKLAADSAPVVDAELTGQLLSVTPRTARRQLRALVDEGLALPLPPMRRQHPGRPRQAYRLVVEKLERLATQ